MSDMTQKARELIKEINVEFENEYKPRLEALEKAQAEGKSGAEIQATIDVIDDKLNSVQKQLDETNASMKASSFTTGSDKGDQLAKDYREILSNKLLKSKNPNLTAGEKEVVDAYTKSMNVTTANQGGVLVPTDTALEIQTQIEAMVPFLSIGNVRQTSFAETSFLVQTGKTAAATATGEATGESDSTAPTVEEILIRADHIEAEPWVTRELLEDSAVDIMSFIQSDIAESIADQFGSNIVSALLAAGAATSAYDEIKEIDAAAGTAGEFTLDDLYDVKYDLDRRYKQTGNTSWVMGDEAMKIMRKLKDENGQYLWQSSQQIGEPNNFDGEAVYFTPNMPAISGSADVDAVLYGNFNKGLGIVQHVGGNFIVVDELTDKKYVKFYTKQRWGADTVDARALRILRTAA
jgi:HK97 family phage major capsid protein